MSKQLFVKTTDEYTANLLIEQGFTLLSSDGKVWTFVNDVNKKHVFDDKKIIYTDKLCF